MPLPDRRSASPGRMHSNSVTSGRRKQRRQSGADQQAADMRPPGDVAARGGQHVADLHQRPEAEHPGGTEPQSG